MSSLSDKLKKMGVQVGADKLPKQAGKKFPIESVVEGELRATPQGEAFVVEEVFPVEHRHGTMALKLASPMALVAAWAGEERIAEKDYVANIPWAAEDDCYNE